MRDDVNAALDRFQQFLGRFSVGEVIDQESGFTAADGQLLAGEVEMADVPAEPDENPID